MRNFRNAALGLLGAAALAAASDVHELKQDSFPDFIKENDLVLAEFFAPWCGHCKALAPEYEEAATTLKEKGIPLAKVDCTAESELCSEYGVEGYPTLKVFRGSDNITPYTGQRKAQAIISFMTKQSMPAVSLLNQDTIEDFKTSDKVVVVAYFDATDKKSNDTFTKVADSLRDSFLFGATSDSELAEKEGAKQPGIVLYKTFDEGKNTFQDEFSEESIEKFIGTASIPLIGEVGPETYAGYMAAGIPLAYIFAETPEDRESLATALKPVAEKHKGAVNFATIDAKSFGQHASNLNLEVGKWPAFAIQETVKNQKFPLLPQDGKLDEKSVGSFVDDFVAGKVEPSIKSEPIPEKQEGPVTVVVAKNYQEIVLDEEKDVLIEFYAPWCGHCKALAPKYEELAQLYAAQSSHVTIAKVDATANDVPDEIAGFPTIKLYPAGGKSEPVSYSGARTVEDLAAFVKEQGKYGADAYAEDAEKTELKKKSAKAEGDDAAEEAAEEEKKTDMPHQAPAATKVAADKVKEAVKEKASEVKEAVKEAAKDSDSDAEDHDEL
ncbi:MAG: protein disulfide-isomerase precursor [Bathelium mastoideum]|nr:MAG: protein disulfide-isomerase precursor [Bathelium mastoideum]